MHADSTNGNNATSVDHALRELIQSYHDLNANVVDELYEEPSALEFMQYVAKNRPFVVRKGAESWKAVQCWDRDYLVDVIGDSAVNVAITPRGNADAIVSLPDKSLAFVEPLERQEPFSSVLSYIQAHEKSGSGPVRYAQTQNDNLRNEYASLFSDVPKSIPFARIALRKQPEAINLWLGNSASVTSLHKDNYENIYAQIRGEKHFVLLPPIAAAAVNEKALPAATFAVRRSGDGETGDVGESPELADISVDDLQPVLDNPAEDVPVATWDPDLPVQRATTYSSLATPLRVTLREGDLLYLPALWYHKVSQSCGDEGFCCAVNYWYDMDFAGTFWASNAFIRDISRIATSAGP